MFVGHYSVAFAVITDKIPLWVLFVAVQFLDYIWATLQSWFWFVELSRPGVCFGNRVACAGHRALSGTQCNSGNSQGGGDRFRNHSRSYSDRRHLRPSNASER